jgi:hypothetical protein
MQRPAPNGSAPASAPESAPTVPDRTSDRAADLKDLLSRLSYKPDPYAEAPTCVSEAKSTVRDDLLLTLRMQLTRAADGTLQLGEAAYFVSETKVAARTPSTAVAGIPRLELVHTDGTVEASDFVGVHGEPGSERSTRDVPPPDATLVKAWLASAPVRASVVAHRVVLDGRVLREVKRPAAAPELSAIRCDPQKSEGVKLSWSSRAGDASSPLLVDVLRHGPLGFVEELPFADARTVSGFTMQAPPQGNAHDAVLLVSLTDTFRIVTRGVLVPKEVR